MTAAQNQHYVPKFILRQFLSNIEKEQVTVFDKETDRIFVTSIKNIMAEHRFNEFVFNDQYVCFEGVVTKLEELIIPVYQDVVSNRKLTTSQEDKQKLAFLLAFQYHRTRNNRQVYVDLEQDLKEKIESAGGLMNNIRGWEPLTEDRLKQMSIAGMAGEMITIANLILQKTIFLMEAPENKSFYLGDDPVCLHNERTFGPYGNIGFAVPGIQISLPLSASLLLCAWCPTIVNDLDAEASRIKQKIFGMLASGLLSLDEARASIEKSDAYRDEMRRCMAAGKPLKLDNDNMDWYNSMQVSNAGRYILCQNADFLLARRFNKERPGRRRKINIA